MLNSPVNGEHRVQKDSRIVRYGAFEADLHSRRGSPFTTPSARVGDFTPKLVNGEHVGTQKKGRASALPVFFNLGQKTNFNPYSSCLGEPSA
jgi:hypothetical protein